MAQLSGVQVAKLAHDVGLRGDRLVQAVAISKAESGWRSDAVGDVSLQTAMWGPSLGLWQIRSLKVQRGTGGARDATRLHDPAFNAKSMAIISKQGTNWQPWSVWKDGKYKAHLADAIRSVEELGKSPGTYSRGGEHSEPLPHPGPSFGTDPVTGEGGTFTPDGLSRFVTGTLGIPDMGKLGWMLLAAAGVILGLILIIKDLSGEVVGGALGEVVQQAGKA